MKHYLQLLFVPLLSCLISLLVALPSATSAQSLDEAAECGATVNFETAADCKKDTKAASDEAVTKCVDDKKSGTAAEKKADCEADLSASGQIEDLLKTVLNILSAVVAVVAIIMIIIGGLKYVLSSGDSNNASSAKNTILYALVGLVIAAFAQVIVQFILGRTT